MDHLAREFQTGDILTPEITIKKCHKTMINPSFFVLPLQKHPQLKGKVGVDLRLVSHSLA